VVSFDQTAISSGLPDHHITIPHQDSTFYDLRKYLPKPAQVEQRNQLNSPPHYFICKKMDSMNLKQLTTTARIGHCSYTALTNSHLSHYILRCLSDFPMLM